MKWVLSPFKKSSSRWIYILYTKWSCVLRYMHAFEAKTLNITLEAKKNWLIAECVITIEFMCSVRKILLKSHSSSASKVAYDFGRQISYLRFSCILSHPRTHQTPAFNMSMHVALADMQTIARMSKCGEIKANDLLNLKARQCWNQWSKTHGRVNSCMTCEILCFLRTLFIWRKTDCNAWSVS